MKKSFIFVFYILIVIFCYADVKWSGEDGKLTVVYKIVDPIIVDVDKPKKITVTSNQQSFSYSQMNGDNSKIEVRVTVPYNSGEVDDILRAIYERVHFRLQNSGKFDLVLDKNTSEIIQGQAYFIDNAAGATTTNKKTEYFKDFSNTVAGNQFYTTSQIDVDFTTTKSEMPMGIYRGILKLDVWFDGTIK